MDLVQEASGLQGELADFRQFLHRNAEVDMNLPITAAYVKEQLEKMGYAPEEICPSGILAVAGGKRPGKTVLLRADMDALPFDEEVDIPCRSTTGNMHACGHDLHTAMLLGAAKLLKEHEDEIEGSVKLMFQPAEETLKGARAMIEAGVLENPAVDMAMMIHVATGLPVTKGSFLLPSAGSISASSDTFNIKIIGKGGHGAMPNHAIDPLIPLSNIHLGLQSINSREIGAFDQVVVTVGQINGGQAPNVIPDSAFMKGTIRTFNNNHRAFVKSRMKDIAEGIAKSYRCDMVLEFGEGCPSITVPPEAAEQFNQIMTELFDGSSLIPFSDVMPGGKFTGGEDFAFVSEKTASVMTVFVVGDSREGEVYPLHHPKAFFDESMLFKGSAAYAGFALKWLKQNKY